MPSEHYLVIAQLVLSAAPEDIPNIQQIKTLIKVFLYQYNLFNISMDNSYNIINNININNTSKLF